MATLHIEGADELRRMLGDLRGNEVLRRPMTRSLYRLLAHMSDYARVLGPPSRTYLRGHGRVNRFGFAPILTSQHLGKRWTHEVREEGGGLVGVLGNVVTYGPYVHAAEGAPHQAWMHRERGAKTDAQVMSEEESWIRAEFDQALQNICDGGRP